VIFGHENNVSILKTERKYNFSHFDFGVTSVFKKITSHFSGCPAIFAFEPQFWSQTIFSQSFKPYKKKKMDENFALKCNAVLNLNIQA